MEVKLQPFLAHYDSLQANIQTEDGFLREFMALKAQSQRYKEQSTYPADAGSMPVNRKKNRFKDILPFEYTRVSLHPIEGVAGSDYINANYIAGPGMDITYIAAQGPLPHTVNDFWRMLWYHNIEIVVMACKEVEMGKVKCQCYWPPLKETAQFGAVCVTTDNEENVENDFMIRDFIAEYDGEQQHIRQYHYMSWPDHDKPKSPEPVLRMLDMIHDYRKRTEVPIAVHCSAGCGRTGTILAIDIARSMFSTKSIPWPEFSVSRLVECMRQQRPAMVQAKDQYLFVYLAAVEMARRGQMAGSAPGPGGQRQQQQQQTGAALAGATTAPIYANADSLGLSLPQAGAGESPTASSEGPLAPARYAARYENINPKATVPVPVARKRTVAAENGSKEEEEEGVEEVGKASPPIAPKPRVRTQPADSTAKADKQPSGPRKPLPQIPEKTESASASGASGSGASGSGASGSGASGSGASGSGASGSGASGSGASGSGASGSGASGVEIDAVYSVVDTSAFTDTGPEILVVDESSGKKAPLAKLEKLVEKRQPGHTPGHTPSHSPSPSPTRQSSKPSILDTIIALVGEDIATELESDGESSSLDLPSPPRPVTPLPNREAMTVSGEVPPAIPMRTLAYMELLEEDAPPPLPTTPIPSRDLAIRKSASSEAIKTMTGVYEAPTEFSKPVSQFEPTRGTASFAQGPSPTSSSSLSSHVATIPRGSVTLPPPASSSSSSSSSSLRLGGVFGKLRMKKPERKPATRDISAPIGKADDGAGGRNSPLRNGVEAGVARNLGNNLHDSANERYKFPGDVGYGIRVGKPGGPRPEPAHWRQVVNHVK